MRSPLAGLGLFACLCAADAFAGEKVATWPVVPRVGHSDVTVNGNDGRRAAWSVGVARETALGQRWATSLARQGRNGLVDDEVHLWASGRMGAWDAVAALQFSPDPILLPEWGYQVRADRAAGRNRGAGVRYRRLQFNDGSVRLGSAQMMCHRGGDEFGVEYRFGCNAALDHDMRVVQPRDARRRGRDRFGVHLARGDYLFDALGIPGGDGDGWSANLASARTLTPSTTLRREAGTGGEAGTFRQRSIALSLGYSP